VAASRGLDRRARSNRSAQRNARGPTLAPRMKARYARALPMVSKVATGALAQHHGPRRSIVVGRADAQLGRLPAVAAIQRRAGVPIHERPHVGSADGHAGGVTGLDEQGHLQDARRAGDRADHVMLDRSARAGAAVTRRQDSRPRARRASVPGAKQLPSRWEDSSRGRTAARYLWSPLREPTSCPSSFGSELCRRCAICRAGSRALSKPKQPTPPLVVMTYRCWSRDQGDVSHGGLSKVGSRTPALAGRARGRLKGIAGAPG
jgi:hypothetical protein